MLQIFTYVGSCGVSIGLCAKADICCFFLRRLERKRHAHTKKERTPPTELADMIIVELSFFGGGGGMTGIIVGDGEVEYPGMDIVILLMDENAEFCCCSRKM